MIKKIQKQIEFFLENNTHPPCAVLLNPVSEEDLSNFYKTAYGVQDVDKITKIEGLDVYYSSEVKEGEVVIL